MPNMLEWDKVTEKLYETGVKNCALYPQVGGAYPKGVAWNGIINITDSPSGGEPSPLYADDTVYANLISTETLGIKIEAYMYPDEFKPCNGELELAKGVSVGQQKRQSFGIAYKTILGNDTELDSYGYKLHIVYGCLAGPSEKSHDTVNESPDAMTMSWDIKTTPVTINTKKFKPTASIEIDSTKVDATKLEALEKVLFGSLEAEARLPLPDEIATIMSDAQAAG